MKSSLRMGLGLGVAACGIWLSVSAASASPAYPGIVGEVVGAADAPPCTICHTVPTGGLGTAETALAKYLRSRGLHAGDPDALRSALSADEAEQHDADGDGAPDTIELMFGTDPNSGSTLPPPSYGCSAAPSRGRAADPGLVLAIGWTLLRAQQRRRVQAQRCARPEPIP